jgi:hypothetical protein
MSIVMARNKSSDFYLMVTFRALGLVAVVLAGFLSIIGSWGGGFETPSGFRRDCPDRIEGYQSHSKPPTVEDIWSKAQEIFKRYSIGGP